MDALARRPELVLVLAGGGTRKIAKKGPPDACKKEFNSETSVPYLLDKKAEAARRQGGLQRRVVVKNTKWGGVGIKLRGASKVSDSLFFCKVSVAGLQTRTEKRPVAWEMLVHLVRGSRFCSKSHAGSGVEVWSLLC